MGILKRFFSSGEKEKITEQPKFIVGTDGKLRIGSPEQKKDVVAEKTELECPYCGKTLEKRPQRKKKCPFCDNMICIRNDALVTEKRAGEIDKERKEEREEQRRKRDIEDACEKFGFSLTDYQKREKKFSKKMRGTKPSQVDVILSLFNEKVSKSKSIEGLSNYYYSMALFLNKNEKEFFHFLQLSAKMKLKELKAEGWKKTEILTSGKHSCPSCRKLEGKILSIEKALKTMPIPNKECSEPLYDESRGFCRCEYESAGDLPLDKFK